MPIRQFTVYVGVGVLSALVDIGTMTLLLGLGADSLAAVTLGFLVGLSFNYLCHERITFRAVRSRRTILRFGMLVLLNYALTLLCVQLSLHWLGSVLAGKLASLPLVAVHGFLWGRYWVFRQQAIAPGNS